MPPPVDLTGRRFGRLVVVDLERRLPQGRTRWLCRCDCGAELVVPQYRLPHTPSTAKRRAPITACPDCRSRPCEVCGGPVPPPSTSATCSEECRIERRRRKDREHYHRKAADPAYREAQRILRSEQWHAQTPDEKLETGRRRRARKIETHGREKLNAQGRASHARRMEDPDYAEKRREQSRQWRDEHPEAARRSWRDWRRRKRAQATAQDLGEAAERLKEKLSDGES